MGWWGFRDPPSVVFVVGHTSMYTHTPTTQKPAWGNMASGKRSTLKSAMEVKAVACLVGGLVLGVCGVWIVGGFVGVKVRFLANQSYQYIERTGGDWGEAKTHRGELVAHEHVDGEGGQGHGDGHDVPREARHCFWGEFMRG